MRDTRKETELADRRRRVGEMYLEGKYLSEIASILSVDISQVSRDLKRLRGEWLQSSLVNINEAKARELAKIDKLERTYYAAWYSSEGEKEIITTKGVAVLATGGREVGEASVPTAKEIRVRRWKDVGKRDYLSGVEWCINKRCEILGLNAPVKQEHSGVIEINDPKSELKSRIAKILTAGEIAGSPSAN